MPSVVRIVPKRVSVISVPATQPKESMWAKTTTGDLVITSLITGRSGSWVSAFNVALLDTPPIIEWEYSDVAQNNATASVQHKASRSKLTVSAIDVQPSPLDIFPDTHWTKSGNDLIPRSV
jgi:hypothetical protein